MPTHILTLTPAVLQRGFWLYVWRVTVDAERIVVYVGRTGDSSSPNAQAPFTRMGQHLGYNEKQNALRRRLKARDILPEACQNFELICHGPIYPEVVRDNDSNRDTLMEAHISIRDMVGAMERQLCQELKDAGYDVLNTVNCRAAFDTPVWQTVRVAFAEHFPLFDGAVP